MLRDDGSADAAVVGPCAYRDIWRGLTDAFPAPLRAADDIRWWSWGVTAGLSMKEFISADSNGRCCLSQDTASDLMTPGGSRQGG